MKHFVPRRGDEQADAQPEDPSNQTMANINDNFDSLVQQTHLAEARTIPALANLPGDVLARLLANATLRRFGVGRVLFGAGERARGLHCLISGAVELYASSGEGDGGILVMVKGDIFMPAAALFDEPYLHAARVVQPARVLTLDAKVVRSQAEISSELTLALAKAIGGQFRMTVRHVIDLKCRPAAQRLASVLLRIADDHPGPGQPRLPIAKRNLAVRLGMTAETLSRTLRTLSEYGLVVRGATIDVRDRDKIEAFCGPALYAGPHEASLGVRAI